MLVKQTMWAMQQEVFFQLLRAKIVTVLLESQKRKWVHREFCTLDHLSWLLDAGREKKCTDSSQCSSNKHQQTKVKNPLKFQQASVHIQPDGLAPEHKWY